MQLFHTFTPSRAPRRATPDAMGSMPMRPARYCEPMRKASAYGTYLFPPVGLILQFDGQRLFASWGDGSETMVIDEKLDWPGYPEKWAEAAPEGLKHLYTPHITAFIDLPGVFQFNLGVVVRTAPGWGVMVRRPPNFMQTEPIEISEGFVDTDTWSGSLIVGMRITKTDVPVMFHKHRPIVQIQPMPRRLLGDGVSDDMVIEADHPSKWPQEVWDAYKRSMTASENDRRKPGVYARDARRAGAAAERGVCPVAHGGDVE